MFNYFERFDLFCLVCEIIQYYINVLFCCQNKTSLYDNSGALSTNYMN
jgi:hypothetical protein